MLRFFCFGTFFIYSTLLASPDETNSCTKVIKDADSRAIFQSGKTEVFYETKREVIHQRKLDKRALDSSGRDKLLSLLFLRYFLPHTPKVTERGKKISLVETEESHKVRRVWADHFSSKGPTKDDLEDINYSFLPNLSFNLSNWNNNLQIMPLSSRYVDSHEYSNPVEVSGMGKADDSKKTDLPNTHVISHISYRVPGHSPSSKLREGHVGNRIEIVEPIYVRTGPFREPFVFEDKKRLDQRGHVVARTVVYKKDNEVYRIRLSSSDKRQPEEIIQDFLINTLDVKQERPFHFKRQRMFIRNRNILNLVPISETIPESREIVGRIFLDRNYYLDSKQENLFRSQEFLSGEVSLASLNRSWNDFLRDFILDYEKLLGETRFSKSSTEMALAQESPQYEIPDFWLQDFKSFSWLRNAQRISQEPWVK